MFKFLAGFFLSLSLVFGVAYRIFTTYVPSAEEIRGCMTTRMYQVHLCPGSKDYVPLHEISVILQKTILLTEDSTFYQHRGFDWVSIERSAREGWESGLFKRGGSTITQQLAKNMFLSKERTFWRKGLEALITYKIEKTLSKKEILERYFNVIEFGKDIYGIKKASSFYFKKRPADLTVLESAFLAMILPNPIKYSHSFHKKSLTPFAHARLTQIVDNLYLYKRIDQIDYDIATIELQSFLSPSPSTENTEELQMEEEDEFF